MDMNIQLIQGQFSSKDAMDIITKMIHVKIKFNEDKIDNSSNEEDIKMRERKIKQLQKDLYEIKNMSSKQDKMTIEALININ